MIIAKIESANEHCEMTARGDFKTLVAEYTMIGVNLANVFAEKDPDIAKVFEAMIHQACEDGLFTDPAKAAKEKAKKKVKNTEKCEFTIKDALDKLKDILEELEK